MTRAIAAIFLTLFLGITVAMLIWAAGLALVLQAILVSFILTTIIGVIAYIRDKNLNKRKKRK